MDRTEQNPAGEILKKDEQLQQLADSMRQMAWIASPDGSPAYYNKNWTEYTGISLANAVGWDSIIHPGDIVTGKQAWEESLKTGQAFEAEYRIKNKTTGDYRWFLVQGTPVKNEDGTIKWFGICTDIHGYKEQIKATDELEIRVNERTKELLQANAKLAVSNQELEQFAYVASHDLQEPLRKIQAFGDILNNRYKDQLEDSGKDMINRMQSAADRMKILIEDLLSYSRVSRKADMEMVDTNKVVNEVINDLYTAITEKKAKITLATLAPINGNALQLRQLFQNLVGNALKFTAESTIPEIDVTMQIVDGAHSGFPLHGDAKNRQYQLIEIKDNGIGFEQQYAEKIFQMFQRLHGRAEYPGSGVGLSIVQKVVENHHGQIQAFGKPGEGSVFRMIFPVSTNGYK